jgi:hypothetical protein
LNPVAFTILKLAIRWYKIPIIPNRTFERKENKSTQMVIRMNKKRAL